MQELYPVEVKASSTLQEIICFARKLPRKESGVILRSSRWCEKKLIKRLSFSVQMQEPTTTEMHNETELSYLQRASDVSFFLQSSRGSSHSSTSINVLRPQRELNRDPDDGHEPRAMKTPRATWRSVKRTRPPSTGAWQRAPPILTTHVLLPRDRVGHGSRKVSACKPAGHPYGHAGPGHSSHLYSVSLTRGI